MQMFYPFREKLTSYRGYQILGDEGLKQNHRSIVISKNRYGIANQVVNLWFFGSVGWFGELPDPDSIDYSKYRHENQCIPCKTRSFTVVKENPSDFPQNNEFEEALTNVTFDL